MKTPYEKHLTWLLLLKQTPEEIEYFYENATLPVPDNVAMMTHAELAIQLPLSPATHKRIVKKIYNKIDESFFQRLGYYELYLKDVAPERLKSAVKIAWEEVDSLLQNPVVRLCVDCLIITKLASEDIVQILGASTYQYQIQKESIDLYKQYFFSVEHFSKEDWRTLLRLVGNDAFTYTRYHTALTRPKEEVIYLLELPTKRTFSDFLSSVLFTSDYKFRYYSRQNTEDGDKQAREWAKVGVGAGEKYEKYSSRDVTDFAEAVQTGFEYAEASIPMADAELVNRVRPDIDVEPSGEDLVPPPLDASLTENEPF